MHLFDSALEERLRATLCHCVLQSCVGAAHTFARQMIAAYARMLDNYCIESQPTVFMFMPIFYERLVPDGAGYEYGGLAQRVVEKNRVSGTLGGGRGGLFFARAGDTPLRWSQARIDGASVLLIPVRVASHWLLGVCFREARRRTVVVVLDSFGRRRIPIENVSQLAKHYECRACEGKCVDYVCTESLQACEGRAASVARP